MDSCETTAGYRRAIEVTGAQGVTTAEMEDDFHHFRIRVGHDGAIVTGIGAQAVRHPWSLCPAAAARLQDLVGTPLATSLAEVLARLPIREHCTHMYDLAALAIVHAAAGTRQRRYDMRVADRVDGHTRARLAIDDVPTLDWRIDGSDIVAPVALSLKRGFVEAAESAFGGDRAEAAMLLRRAVFVSNGRDHDLDDRAFAADGARNMGGCFVMRSGTAEHAARMTGSTRDFTASGAGPLAGRDQDCIGRSLTPAQT